jgi:hypothetical protein
MFNVGDKVRVSSKRFFWYPHEVGDVGVVTVPLVRGKHTDNEYVVVRFDGTARPVNTVGDDGWLYPEEDLELVAP